MQLTTGSTRSLILFFLVHLRRPVHLLPKRHENEGSTTVRGLSYHTCSGCGIEASTLLVHHVDDAGRCQCDERSRSGGCWLSCRRQPDHGGWSRRRGWRRGNDPARWGLDAPRQQFCDWACAAPAYEHDDRVATAVPHLQQIVSQRAHLATRRRLCP